jgi:hypothetical protein
MRRERTIAAGHLAAVASMIVRQMMKCVLAVLCFALTWRTAYAAQAEHSTSPSRQFVIYGGDAKLRGAISGLAEQTKTNLLGLLRQRDDWKTPVIVNLQSKQSNLPELPAADLRFSQTGFGIKLQLDLTISKSIDVSLIERELLRAILLEMVYRNHPHIKSGAMLVEPPDWLVDGALALSPGRDRGPLIEAIADTEKPVSLEKFLRQRPGFLDSTGRALYRAYAFVLVQLLLDVKNGGAQLAKYIDRLYDSSNDPVANLEAQFPLLVDNAEQTWQSALNHLKNLQTFRLFTFAESERRLDELLIVKISEPNKPLKLVRLDELAQHKLSTSERMALDQLKRDLLVLVPQTNPVLRPIGHEYQEIAAMLGRGKRRGVAKRLAHLELTRQQLAARMTEIDDYMNWFEATQMNSGSGNFTGYLKAVDQSQLPAQKRRDPLSVYVDAVEDQFGE